MVFSSTIFLFLFLPATLALYHLTGRLNVVLLGASLLFYAWGEPTRVAFFAASIVLNHLFALLVDAAGDERRRRLALSAAVVVNLALLVWFKYAAFLAGNLDALLRLGGLPVLGVEPDSLPLGISFFTFQAMSYVIDVYRRDATAERNPVRVGLYVALFPQLVAGPIVRYVDVAAQIARRTVPAGLFASGVRRFAVGLAKKVLIANTLASPADAIFTLPQEQLTAGLAWLGIACYTLQIFFDFSGYSDMAIGLGHMFGFRFLENFDYPYVSRSVTEFWRRWHISLSTWFRDYLYLPLGGNRRGTARTYANLVTVFVLCGLWHGASWTFLVWGLYHGLFLVLERLGLGSALARVTAPLRVAYTLLVVMIGWVFFRAGTLGEALSFMRAMVGFGAGDGVEQSVGLYANGLVSLMLVIGAVAATPIARWTSRARERLSARGRAGDAVVDAAFAAGEAVACALLLIVSAAGLASGTYNPFIYFRF